MFIFHQFQTFNGLGGQRHSNRGAAAAGPAPASTDASPVAGVSGGTAPAVETQTTKFDTTAVSTKPTTGGTRQVSQAPASTNVSTATSSEDVPKKKGAERATEGPEEPAEEGYDLFMTTNNLVNIAQLSCRDQKISIEDFKLLKVIGKGSYGKVMLVQHLDGGTDVYAMKMLRKENIVRRNQVEHTKTERHVLKNINHPFIVHLYYAFQTPKKLYFVMEYCPGGELFYHLSRAGRFTEARCCFYAAQIVLALEHLHKLGVIYRDLKPENVLLDSDGYIRLTDFGLSKEGINDNSSARSLCGTPEYLAPEILNQSGHGKAVDWWSLGALIFEMLTGLPPFYTKDRETLFRRIRFAELVYPSVVSPNAKSLMKGLFSRNPEERLGAGPSDAETIKSHPFFSTMNWDDLYSKLLTPPFLPNLQSDTDVSYFDADFVKMPVINSEVPESALAQAAASDMMFEGFTYDRRDHEGLGAHVPEMQGIMEEQMPY